MHNAIRADFGAMMNMTGWEHQILRGGFSAAMERVEKGEELSAMGVDIQNLLEHSFMANRLVTARIENRIKKTQQAAQCGEGHFGIKERAIPSV